MRETASLGRTNYSDNQGWRCCLNRKARRGCASADAGAWKGTPGKGGLAFTKRAKSGKTLTSTYAMTSTAEVGQRTP